MYIDECIEGIHRLMASDYTQPINIGSARMISINDLVYLIADLCDKKIVINNVPGPQGVMGRVSDNQQIRRVLGWEPPDNLESGLEQTLKWIAQQRYAQA
jgi:nucleoside-diphosphate-sugar epimerase